MSERVTQAETISLIGMPGAGKSTVGRLLAQQLGLRFADTDRDIESRAGMTLQEIIDSSGHLALRAQEEAVLLSVDLSNAVVATGGSVIYSKAIMERLQQAGPVLYLRVELPTLEQRVAAEPPRGIASGADFSYADVYAERCPLYEHYADASFDGSAAVDKIVTAIRSYLVQHA